MRRKDYLAELEHEVDGVNEKNQVLATSVHTSEAKDRVCVFDLREVAMNLLPFDSTTYRGLMYICLSGLPYCMYVLRFAMASYLVAETNRIANMCICITYLVDGNPCFLLRNESREDVPI